MDLAFSADPVARLRAATSLDMMMKVVAADLAADEVAQVRIGVAAKLLQWCEWRARLPEADDIAFIGRRSS